MSAIMIQATGSNAGKSLMVAGLCRYFRNEGLKVRPFKPQNMSNNAAVTADGGEIGRAQALQARACGVAPSADMNPVLLKPESERGAQVIVRGQYFGGMQADDYLKLKPQLMADVLESYRNISEDADIVIVEGAGSPAEVNLRDGDIANMGFAEAANIPVILLGDIDKGGVIASIIGTHALLTKAEQRRIRGFVINKFRGDISLFKTGIEIIAEKTAWPDLGIVPWFANACLLPQEDALGIPGSVKKPDGKRKISILQLPRIANFDDFDPLYAEPEVSVHMVTAGETIPADSDLVIIPGTKSTMADLRFLLRQGWDIDMKAHVRRGGTLLGICGGYQMLGKTISDPDGTEGYIGRMDGIGLLDVQTVIGPQKKLQQSRRTHIPTNLKINGYEIHMGKTSGKDCDRAFSKAGVQTDGAMSVCGKIAGTYIHGLFAEDEFRRKFLSISASGPVRYDERIELTLDELAAHLGKHINCNQLITIAEENTG
jgi:adenosylcobyric acid synthase